MPKVNQCDALTDSPETEAPAKPKPGFTLSRDIDWEPIRKAFIERPLRATYDELGAEFGVKGGTIGRCAADEGWATLRAQHFERKLMQADASAVLLEAVKVDRTMVREIADYALVSIRRLKAAVESVDESRAPSTKIDCYNTANFALANLARAMKDVGIVGLPKGLTTNGTEQNGQWNPQMLAQINVNVGEIIAKARSELSTAVDVNPEPKSTS